MGTKCDCRQSECETVDAPRRPAEPHEKQTNQKRKTIMTKKLIMMVAAVAVAFGAWAETETVGGYTWTYQINGGTAEILV